MERESVGEEEARKDGAWHHKSLVEAELGGAQRDVHSLITVTSGEAPSDANLLASVSPSSRGAHVSPRSRERRRRSLRSISA